MKTFFDSIVYWLLTAAVALVLVLAWSTDHYRAKERAVHKDLTQLQKEVGEQNRTAQAMLARLTVERDTAQAVLKRQREEQEKTDATNLSEIARLGDELKHRPVRVRLVPGSTTCGAGGGGPQGAAATTNTSGAADPTEAYGLLPAGNSARLGVVIAEAETINAAYASCRAQLFHQIDNVKP